MLVTSSNLGYSVENLNYEFTTDALSSLNFDLCKGSSRTAYSLTGLIEKGTEGHIYEVTSGSKFKAIKWSRVAKRDALKEEYNRLARLHVKEDGKVIKHVPGIMRQFKCLVEVKGNCFAVMSRYESCLFPYGKLRVGEQIYYKQSPPNEQAIVNLRNEMPTLVQITRQMLLGVKACHDNDMLIRDVKLENTLQRTKNGVTEYALCDLAGKAFTSRTTMSFDLSRIKLFNVELRCHLKAKNAVMYETLSKNKLNYQKGMDVRAVAITILLMIDFAKIQFPYKDHTEKEDSTQPVLCMVPLTINEAILYGVPYNLFAFINVMCKPGPTMNVEEALSLFNT